MGILDDAIREHLELKRRGGADPAEISRLEREAFGAREAESAAPPAATAVEDVESAAQVPPADEPQAPPALEVEPAPADVEPPAPEPEPEPPVPVPEPEPESLEPAAEQRPEPPEHDQPTRQFSAEELRDAVRPGDPAPPPEPAGEPGDHDELEETPEFLQETPEHDRLWFEQKPPKDFDF
jgi:hypothetical protein